MKHILFIDNIFENGIPRYEFKGLSIKVSQIVNVKVNFRTIPPIVQEFKEDNNLRYEVSEFDEYELIFIHDSYNDPLIERVVMNLLADRYETKLYRFSGGTIPDKNGIKRDDLYTNLVSFVKFVDRYEQFDLQIINNGPADYLEKKYKELLDEISNPDDWKNYLVKNWWFYLQDCFKLSNAGLQLIREEIKELEYFSEFDQKLEEIKNQAYRRLFL